MQKGFLSEVIGQTPLIKIKSLSEMTGCEIYGKAEFLNPGGSVKDRAAKSIIESAEKDGKLQKGMMIFEGTAGNTGIGLAQIAAQKGYACTIVMPNNQSEEKYQILEALGANLVKVAPCPFADQNHFYHTARRLAEASTNSFWANQFENLANFQAHYRTTGPEIWQQISGKIDHFCAATGTGGTLAGVSRFLKEKSPTTTITLVDPMGSGLFHWFKNGQIKSEGSSVTEGIGIMRLTANFKEAQIDEAIQIDDQMMINMLYHLAKNEGLLVGTSSALNVCAAYQIALKNNHSSKKIVTILCDSALRYQSRVFNQAWLKEKNLQPQELT